MGLSEPWSGPGQPRYRNLKGLLVSETFANLERLASAQVYRTANLVDPSTGILKEFLPIAGEIRWGGDQDEDLSFDRVCEILDRAGDELRVFVIDGSAGVGKSHLIEQIVRRRANPHSYKAGNPLLVHVESRGKVLTSLNDRIAGTLSGLRASFFRRRTEATHPTRGDSGGNRRLRRTLRQPGIRSGLGRTSGFRPRPARHGYLHSGGTRHDAGRRHRT